MKLIIVALFAIGATGCIEQAPTSQPNQDMTDFGKRIDVGVEDVGIGVARDARTPDTSPADLRASDITEEFTALWTFEQGMMSEVGDFELTPTMSRLSDGSSPEGAYQLELDQIVTRSNDGELGDLDVGSKLLVGGWVSDVNAPRRTHRPTKTAAGCSRIVPIFRPVSDCDEG